MDEIDVINKLESMKLERRIYLTFAVEVLKDRRANFLIYFPSQAVRYDSLVQALTDLAAGKTANLTTIRTQLKTALDSEALEKGCNSIRRELLYAVWRLIAPNSSDEQRVVDFCFAMAAAYAKQSPKTYEVTAAEVTVTYNWDDEDYRTAVRWMRNKLLEIVEAG